MLRTKLGLILMLTTLSLSLSVSAFGQNKFDGVLRNTQDYTVQTPASTAEITVYNQNGLNPGTGKADIFDCNNPTVPLANPFTATGGAYCFSGSDSSYDVKISSDSNKIRRVITENVIKTKGIYRLTDFGAVDSSVLYNADSTYAIKSAMAYIGTRPEPGGKLIVPNGVFKVLSGSAAMLPIVMPPGLTFEGLNGKGNFGSSRVQIEFGNATLFKFGNSADKITIRDLSLVVPLSCDTNGQNCSILPGTKAIRGEVSDNLAAQFFLASSLNIQGFEEGFSLSGVSGSANDGQFGSAKIENSGFGNCLYPVRINAQNAEVEISNTVLLTIKHPTQPEAAVRIDKSGAITMNKVYGGVANRDVNNKPLAFILVKGRHSVIRLNDCQSENTLHNFLYDYNPPADDVKGPIIFNGVGFGDLVIFKGNVIFTSINSYYGANSVQFWGTPKGGASTNSEIYSYGDQFVGLTNELNVCPAASGVVATSYPPERPNGDFHRLTVNDITPVAGGLDKNVCRRDFYLYNNPGENNRVVFRTAQRKYSVGDSNSLGTTQAQTGVEITSPPVYDDLITLRPGIDRFKTWGYRIERNTSSGSLDFLGNQKPPNFLDGNYSNFRFNGGVYPTEDGVYELGNGGNRWAVVRGVTVVSGDTILSDKVTGKELYKIHEDENFIYFTDIRTNKIMMKLGTDGNLYVGGKIIQNVSFENTETNTAPGKKPVVRKKKTAVKKR